MEELNLDATNAILGRLASHAAKQALLGKTINIVNCEKAIISGNRHAVRAKYYHNMFKLGRPTKGPFLSRMPDRFVRRVIRGMLDHKNERGRNAFERVMCYIGTPDAFQKKKLLHVAKDVSELPKLRYQTVGELCTSLGGKL